MAMDEMTTKEMTTKDTDYLHATTFIDSNNPAIVAFAHNALGDAETVKDKALALYGAVRDQIQYDPYIDFLNPAEFRASDVLRAGRGFCVGKSALLAAAARAAGIPARPGYADVRNHLTSKRLKEQVGDTFYWHSYTELKIDGKWVKCTPAFDKVLCERARIKPLDFDGVNDSLFHPFDQAGRRHWNICRIAAPTPMCRSTRSLRISRHSIPSSLPRARRLQASARSHDLIAAARTRRTS